MDIRPVTREDIENMVIASEPWIMSRKSEIIGNLSKGMAWAGYDGDELLGIAGIYELWKGVGEGWLLFSPSFYEGNRRVSAVRKMKRELDLHCAIYDRVQVHVDSTIPGALELVRFFGFRVEGLLEKYCRGRDYWILSRVWQEVTPT
jgi:hypothetical protein